MAKYEYHDAYIDDAVEILRPLLIEMRAQLAQTLPDAEEIIAYDLPGFGFEKSIIVGYAAFSKQCGLYCPAAAIVAHAGEIADAGLKATKTGVTFSPSKPMPKKLISSLALTSRNTLGL